MFYKLSNDENIFVVTCVFFIIWKYDNISVSTHDINVMGVSCIDYVVFIK